MGPRNPHRHEKNIHTPERTLTTGFEPRTFWPKVLYTSLLGDLVLRRRPNPAALEALRSRTDGLTLKSVGVAKQRLDGRGFMVATLMSTEALSLPVFWAGVTSSTLSEMDHKSSKWEPWRGQERPLTSIKRQTKITKEKERKPQKPIIRMYILIKGNFWWDLNKVNNK